VGVASNHHDEISSERDAREAFGRAFARAFGRALGVRSFARSRASVAKVELGGARRG